MTGVLAYPFAVLVWPGVVAAAMLGWLYLWLARKLTARLQGRHGPPFYQPFFDVVKLLGKRTVVPHGVDRAMFYGLPIASLVATTFAPALLPVPGNPIGSFSGDLVVLLYLLEVPVLVDVLAGYVTRSVYGQVSAMREALLSLGYNVPFLAAIVALAQHAETFSISGLHGAPFGIVQVFAALAFVLAIPARLKSNPFSIPNAEQEIVAGAHIEYSGAPLALFELSHALEFVLLIDLFFVLFVPMFTAAWLNVLVWIVVSIGLVVLVTWLAATTARLQLARAFRFTGSGAVLRRPRPSRSQSSNKGIDCGHCKRCVAKPDGRLESPQARRPRAQTARVPGDDRARGISLHRLSHVRVCVFATGDLFCRNQQRRSVAILRRPVFVLRPVRQVLSDARHHQQRQASARYGRSVAAPRGAPHSVPAVPGLRRADHHRPRGHRGDEVMSYLPTQRGEPPRSRGATGSVMMGVDDSCLRIPGGTEFQRRAGAYWMVAPKLDVCAMAEVLKNDGFRLVTMTGLPAEHGETSVMYHYVRGGLELNLRTTSRQQNLPSISAIAKPASWAEREIHDFFGLVFEGHPNLAPLLRPADLKVGFFREPVAGD